VLQQRFTEPYGILVTGVGGTGVVTIGALLGMAAHLEGKGVAVLDMTGIAQKGGAVHTHIRIAETPEQIHAVRIAAGDADLLLGCDIVVGANAESLAKMRPGRTKAVVNHHEAITSEFTRNPDYQFPQAELRARIEEATGPGATEFVGATRLATSLLGDSIASNLFMLGYAWQRGLVPLSGEAIERAIELNAVAVEFNKKAFVWGRRAAHDRAAVERAATPKGAVPENQRISESLDEIVARRVAFLTDYQNAGYARRYEELVRRVERVEREKAKGMAGLAEAVAKNLFKLMAYKDEYEVARLWTETGFLDRVRERFEGETELRFHLAPPLTAERDPVTGHLKKQEFGPWMLRAFRVLAKLRFLRGTALDVFGRTAERRTERRLIGEYETLVAELIERLQPGNHALAVELASIPQLIRGFGHIKDANLASAEAREAKLLESFRTPAPTQLIAAE
jgi:indolepyruvate ferredoxin oxidoreductase